MHDSIIFAADALYTGLITWATDDSKSSGSAPFSLAIFFRAGIILARRSRSKDILQQTTHFICLSEQPDALVSHALSEVDAVNEDCMRKTPAIPKRQNHTLVTLFKHGLLCSV